jgi:two-component system sensor histidine kinase MprB
VTFRRRIALASAAAVAIAVVLAAVLVYVLTSNQLHKQVDTQLSSRARSIARIANVLRTTPEPRARADGSVTITLPEDLDLRTLTMAELRKLAAAVPTSGSPGSGSSYFGRAPPGPGQVRGYQQLANADGTVLLRSSGSLVLPVGAASRRLAAHGGRPLFSDAHVDGLHLRVLAEPLGRGRVLQLAQPLTETDSLLGRLRLILGLLVVGGIALAALLGRLVAGAAMTPLRALTRTAEHVALTRDLSRRIDAPGSDEVGRLAASFNSMLDALQQSIGALDASVHAQRQLIADASHELRTPVTSMRTNIEILQQRGDQMGHAEQHVLFGEVVEQIEELTLLMNDLIQLARDDEVRADTEEVRLDMLVEDVLERAQRNFPETPLEAELAPTLIECVPARLERAVANLLDNAIKHSPPAAPVHVVLAARELSVRDHGAGIADHDLPHVFDRFYRGAEARGRPGSGLGLAIVRQVADQLGASVSAEHAPGGGTLMRLSMPGAEPAVVSRADADGAAAASAR